MIYINNPTFRDTKLSIAINEKDTEDEYRISLYGTIYWSSGSGCGSCAIITFDYTTNNKSSGKLIIKDTSKVFGKDPLENKMIATQIKQSINETVRKKIKNLLESFVETF